MTQNRISVFFALSFLVSTTLLFLSYTENDKPNVLRQNVTAVNLNREFAFAGETLPINDDTRERLDKELSVNAYLQSTTLLNLKRAARYFPEVERILKENEIPEDFKYLAIAESGLRNVTSSASAKGYWQFMLPAAKEMGLEVTEEVDERMHIEKSTKAACAYLNKLYKRFGSWTNAAAAYNMGAGGLAKYIAEQKESDYYHLHLNEETSRYVFRIIAIKDIMSNPETYGYFLEQDHYYQPHQKLKQIQISHTIPNLVDFAKQQKTTLRMLKYYNPWLTGSQLTVKAGKMYSILIPDV
ncbi:MAG: lytic transglycosylase domain-containing protein [Saprospiraceae bacterium]|nr:lytic transglycosylase domain-containing protein [Saprospiraceae bacterium]